MTELIQASLNGGELSPRLHGRVDQNVYGIGLQSCLGWLPTVQGPLVAMPGTHFVNYAADGCILIPFEYSATQGYVIEASDNLMRFYTNDVRIDTSPGVPYEISSPYGTLHLFELDYQQSADVLYMVHWAHKPQKLSRTSATTFAFSDLEPRYGPMGAANSDQALTIQPSGITGNITLTASAPLFTPDDVGRWIEIEAVELKVPSWQSGMRFDNVGDHCQWGNNVYQKMGGAQRAGGNAPVHTGYAQTEWDGQNYDYDVDGNGPYGIQWQYEYGLIGLAKITGFTDSQHVTANVRKTLAQSLTTVPTWKFTMGAFSDTVHPEKVCLWGESLVLTYRNKLYIGAIGDYENFDRRDGSGNFQRDLATSVTLPESGSVRWLSADRMLLIGTDSAEYTLQRVVTQSGTAGPPVFELRKQSSYGSLATKPVEAGGRVQFIQRAGRKLLEFDFDALRDRYKAPDLTRLADHISISGFGVAAFGSGVLAWQQEPERVIWGGLGDGTLAALTYDPDQQVMAWSRRVLGGEMEVESICRITDPSGTRDQIWMSARFGTNRLILRMHKIWEQGDDRKDAFMVDAGLSYDGAPATTFSGLDHLEGWPVQVLADGKVHRDLVVDGGAITLDYAASKVSAGLAFDAKFKTLKVSAPQADGSGQGKKKRIVGAILRVLEAGGIRLKSQNLEPVNMDIVTPETPADSMVPLYSGDYEFKTIGQHDTAGEIEVERFQPLPATVLAIIPDVEFGD